MKIIHIISRYLLGSIFLIFGLNGLCPFITVPEYHPFMEIMVETKFIVIIKILEITGGLLLISGRYTLLALAVLGPIVANILFYHIFIDPRNAIVGFANFTLYLFTFYGYKDHFRHFLEWNPRSDFD